MYLDIVLLLLLVLCMTIGVVRGVLSPLITFFSLLLAVWLTSLVLTPCLGEVTDALRPWEGKFLVTLLTSKFVAGFLMVLIFYFIFASIAEFVKRKLMNALNLRMSDRFLGMICGTCVGLFACVLLCVGLLWARTIVERQANMEGLKAYDRLLHSSEGYSVSLAAVDWLEGFFPQIQALLPEGQLWNQPAETLKGDYVDEYPGLRNH